MMKEKKVLICTLNSKYIHSSLAPWCLFTSAKKYCDEGFAFSVSEGTVNEKEEAILERIKKEKADIISFSCYIWNINKTLSLCKKIKEEAKETVIILGGPEVAYNQAQILMENPFVDFVLSGEGEELFPLLLKSLEKKTWDKISGVSFMNEGKAVVSFASESKETDCPSPYCEEYFSSLNGRIAYIESSRGCPYNCAFCLSGRQGKVRFFPMERVKNEILSLCNHGAKTVKFVDRTFNCHKDRAKEILSFIKENFNGEIDGDVCFHFEISADILDSELISLICSMPEGSVQFEAGIQSFNEDTLKAIGRRNDLEKTILNIKKLTKAGNCHIHVDLIAGLPYENYESFVSGFNSGFYLGANMLQLGFLKILHGSPMGDNREEYPCQYSEEPPYEVIRTPWISSEELDKLRTAENELERLHNCGRFTRTVDYILQNSAMTPYELFYGLGVYLAEKNKKGSIPLDEYTCLVFDYLSAVDGVDRTVLRDKMLYDRIETNNSGVIPERLKIKDNLLKKAKRNLSLIHTHEKGVNRTVGILYSENKVIWCDYKNKHRVTGKYEAEVMPVSELITD